MIDIQKTTADERGLIVDAVCPIMVAVEDAKDLLCEIESSYFEVMDPKLDQTDAERIELIIRVSTNLLYDACTAFGLLTGFDTWGGTKFALSQIEQISRSKRVDDLSSKLLKRERHMDEEKRKSVCATRRKAEELPDEQAETALSALLKEAQNG